MPPPPDRQDDVASWPGASVVGRDGERLGRVDHVYVDQESGRPTFVALCDRDARQPLVPVELVRARDGRLETDLTHDELRHAAETAPDGVLTPDVEAEARRRLGLT